MNSPSRLALITGVGREAGIGFGLAQAMARQGFAMAISARKLAQAQTLAGQLSASGIQVLALEMDITRDDSVQAAAEALHGTFGCLDVLINNAGGQLDYMNAPLETDFATTRQAFETNLFGAWRVIRAMVPLLKRSTQPRIVNISSGAGSFQHPVFGLRSHPALLTSYGLSKLALNGLTVQLARQLGPDGILVNAVNPGFVATAEGMESMGARSVADSVEGIIWAATLPAGGPNGQFFEDKQPIPW